MVAMQKPLSIVVVEQDRDRALLIVDSLRDSGAHDIFVVSEETALARRIKERNPDIVLVDMASPSRDMLEELTMASGATSRRCCASSAIIACIVASSVAARAAAPARSRRPNAAL